MAATRMKLLVANFMVVFKGHLGAIPGLVQVWFGKHPSGCNQNETVGEWFHGDVLRVISESYQV